MSDDIIIHKRWVGGVCIKDDTILLLYCTYKRGGEKKEHFLFPGKEVEGDESLEDAILETFSNLSLSVYLEKKLYVHNEGEDDEEHYYACSYSYGDPKIGKNLALDEKEGRVITPVFIPFHELDTLIIYPESLREYVIEHFSGTLTE